MLLVIPDRFSTRSSARISSPTGWLVLRCYTKQTWYILYISMCITSPRQMGLCALLRCDLFLEGVMLAPFNKRVGGTFTPKFVNVFSRITIGINPCRILSRAQVDVSQSIAELSSTCSRRICTLPQLPVPNHRPPPLLHSTAFPQHTQLDHPTPRSSPPADPPINSPLYSIETRPNAPTQRRRQR